MKTLRKKKRSGTTTQKRRKTRKYHREDHDGEKRKNSVKKGALLKQPFVKDPEVTIEKLLQDAGAQIESFVRITV
jgi:translation elongation factor EF-Ts